MNIIIDSNVLFSALIKDSLTRKLILEYEGFFLFPEFVFEEFEKHKYELLEKMRMSESDAKRLLQLLLSKVLIVPNEKLIPYREQAVEIIGEIDLDDVLFIACALAYPHSVLWSNDKSLKKQTEITIINTAEMKEFIRES